MVPEGWRQVRLGEVVAEFRGGGTPSREQPDFWGGDLPWASVKDLNGDRLKATSESITEEGLSNSAASRVPAGTVILATRMAVGKAVIAEVPLAINQDLKGLLPTAKLLSPYLKVWLNWREKGIAALASGTTVKGIRLATLRTLLLALPPLSEQRKIAAILSSVDDAIATTRKVIEQAKRLKQGLLQTLMTRGIGHTQFKKTEIGEIPEAWEVLPLGEVAAVERGKFTARPRNDPQYYGGQTPFVQTGDVTRSEVELAGHSQTLSERGVEVSRVFPEKTILLTIAANIGEVALATYPVAFPDSVVGIRAGKLLDSRWLLYMLATRSNHLNNAATQNAQKNINLKVLRPLLIPIPDLTEQIAIARRLDEATRSIRSSEDTVESLQNLKRGLMQDLLTGRVRVQPD